MRLQLTQTRPRTPIAGPPSVVLMPADLTALAVVRTALHAALRERGWETEPAHHVLLATTEAVANAVEHGSQPGELVEITYRVGDVESFVRVLDGGGGVDWNPPDTPTPPAATSARGRGLVLIADLADSVEMVRAGQGTEVRLSFVRPLAA